MGATNFIEFQEGENDRGAFAAISDKFAQYCGNDPYNGTIATTKLVGRPVKIADIYTGEPTDRAAYKYAEKNDFGFKWQSRVLDLGLIPGKKDIHMFAFYGWAAC